MFVLNEYLLQKISQDKCLKIKEFINNNIDIIESALAPMDDYFDLYKNAMVIIITYVTIIIRKKLDIFFLVMNIENFMKKL